MLYKKGDKYALCFVGTDMEKWKEDWSANLQMGLTGDSRQIRAAKDFVNQLIEDHGLTRENTIAIGHSEGGTEATHVGLKYNFDVVTFNAYGVYKNAVRSSNHNISVINYRDPHDPISKIKGNIGLTFITPSMQSRVKSIAPWGIREAHSVEKMGDCTQAIEVNVYKKLHPGFVDSLSDAVITNENIDEMAKNKLFTIFEHFLMKRLRKGRIYRERDIRGGMVKVSPYRRDDGTPVSGYYRSYPD